MARDHAQVRVLKHGLSHARGLGVDRALRGSIRACQLDLRGQSGGGTPSRHGLSANGGGILFKLSLRLLRLHLGLWSQRDGSRLLSLLRLSHLRLARLRLNLNLLWLLLSWLLLLLLLRRRWKLPGLSLRLLRHDRLLLHDRLSLLSRRRRLHGHDWNGIDGLLLLSLLLWRSDVTVDGLNLSWLKRLERLLEGLLGADRRCCDEQQQAARQSQQAASTNARWMHDEAWCCLVVCGERET